LLKECLNLADAGQPGAAIRGLKKGWLQFFLQPPCFLELPLLAVVVDAEVGDKVCAYDVSAGDEIHQRRKILVAP
jgi:hypothetical protein